MKKSLKFRPFFDVIFIAFGAFLITKCLGGWSSSLRGRL